MKVALLAAITLLGVAFASPIPVGDLAYDEGFLDEDCEEIDALPAQQMEPFFMEAPAESFEEEDCDDDSNYEKIIEPAFLPPQEERADEQYEDCEEEDSFVEEPAFVDHALNIVTDYEMEDCDEEEQEYAAPALIEREQAVENFYDEECEEEALPAIDPAPQVFEEEADCEDEGEYMEPFAAAPSDPFSVDVLDAAKHAYVMKPEFIAGEQPVDGFEDCEEEPYLK